MVKTVEFIYYLQNIMGSKYIAVIPASWGRHFIKARRRTVRLLEREWGSYQGKKPRMRDNRVGEHNT